MARPKKDVSEKKLELFQLELDKAGDNISQLINDKKGRSRSCLLCRRRKQKCDHKLPSCTACLKAAVKCVQPTNYGNLNTNVTTITSDHNNVIKTTNNNFINSTNNMINNLTNNNTNTNNHNNNVNSGGRMLQINLNTDNNENGNNNEYTKLLEKKLKYLEKLIELNPTSSTYHKKKKNYKKISHLLGNVPDLETNLNFMNNATNANSNINNNLLKKPIINNNTNDNVFSIKNNNTNILLPRTTFNTNNNTSSANNNNVPILSSDSVESIDFSKCIFAKYNLKEFMSYDPVFELNEELTRLFLDTYFIQVQFKYPILDENEIYKFHNDYVNDNIYSYSERDFHFNCGRLWMVYCISSCFFEDNNGNNNENSNNKNYNGYSSVRYFSTAIRHISKCNDEFNYYQQIELLTLLVLYLLRTDRDSKILYDIIKDVIYICQKRLKLNEYNENNPKGLRIFWSIYLIERMICVAVGKEFTISESDINLPYLDDKDIKDNKIHQIEFVNEIIKLRRIESKFVEDLKIIPPMKNKKQDDNNKLIKQIGKVELYFKKLNNWKKNYNKLEIKKYETGTLKLYYFKSVRLLIEPYLEVLPSDSRLFRECQSAAGQICQLYKVLFQRTINGNSTTAVHTIFVAGVTLIYCMWLQRNQDDERRRQLGDDSKHTRPLVNGSLFSTLDDLRACSICLYVLTEKSEFGKIFRDTFDQLMNATIGNLIERCGPDSSELVYLSRNNIKRVREVECMSEEFKTMIQKKRKLQQLGDKEETKRDEMRRKRDVMLEGNPIPKSLSHLLVQEDKTKEMIDKEEKEKNKKEIIVMKSVNSREFFDWEMFEQQAYVQQQQAQQNLQIYLSGLNNNNTRMYEPEMMIRGDNMSSHNHTTVFDSQDTSTTNIFGNPVSGVPATMINNNNTRQHNIKHTSHNNSNDGFFLHAVHGMITDISTWTGDAVVNNNNSGRQ